MQNKHFQHLYTKISLKSNTLQEVHKMYTVCKSWGFHVSFAFLFYFDMQNCTPILEILFKLAKNHFFGKKDI